MNITLATLAQATPQAVFDQVVTHLLTQNKESKNSEGCAYRGDGGLKCAAGCLISDDEYRSEMEDKTWKGLRKGMVAAVKVPARHSSLVTRLQNLHDNHLVRDWPAGLETIAAQSRLKLPQILKDRLKA